MYEYDDINENFDLLTVKDVSDLFKVSKKTVYRWLDAGLLKAVRPGRGRSIRIKLSEVRKLIEG